MVKYKIKTGSMGGEYFIVVIVDDKHVLRPMRLGLDRFFDKWAERENKILEIQSLDIKEGSEDETS